MRNTHESENRSGSLRGQPAIRSSGQILNRPILILGIALLAFAIIALAVSFQLSYGLVRGRLVGLYGEQTVAGHFSEALFSGAVLRLRVGAMLLAIFSVILAKYRDDVARLIGPPLRALRMSFGHTLRSRGVWNLSHAVALVLIGLVGFFVRVAFLNQPMRNDESVTMLGYAAQPVYLTISLYTSPNNHLFHSLLVHYSMALFGNAEWAIRLPAFLSGVLLIPLTYWFAKSFASANAGLLAAALVASSSVLIEYSTNARGYTLVCCATLLLMIAAARALRRAAPFWFAVFAVTAIIGFWTIPIFLIPFVGVVLWMVWESAARSRRFRGIFLLRLLTACFLAGVVTVLVYLPPVAVTGLRSLTGNEWIAPRDFHAFLTGNLAQFRNTWQLWNRDLPSWWGAVAALAFAAGMVLHRRPGRLVICLVFWTATLFFARLYMPFTRTWLLFLPVFLTIAASSVSALLDVVTPRTHLAIVSGIVAVGLTGILSGRVFERQSILTSSETGVLKDARRIADTLLSRNIPAEMVFRNTDYDFPLQYYWWRMRGVRPAKPSVAALEASHATQAWILINPTLHEAFDSTARQYGFADARIVETIPFDGALLCRFTWASTPGLFFAALHTDCRSSARPRISSVRNTRGAAHFAISAVFSYSFQFGVSSITWY